MTSLCDPNSHMHNNSIKDVSLCKTECGFIMTTARFREPCPKNLTNLQKVTVNRGYSLSFPTESSLFLGTSTREVIQLQ